MSAKRKSGKRPCTPAIIASMAGSPSARATGSAWRALSAHPLVSGATKNNKLHELHVWNWKAAREAAVEKAVA